VITTHHGLHVVVLTLCIVRLWQQKLTYPRGIGLGGSASINYLAFIRGSRHDYDEWAELGCSGWSYRDVLPYMMKCEDNSNSGYANNGNRPEQYRLLQLKNNPLFSRGLFFIGACCMPFQS